MINNNNLFQFWWFFFLPEFHVIVGCCCYLTEVDLENILSPPPNPLCTSVSLHHNSAQKQNNREIIAKQNWFSVI